MTDLPQPAASRRSALRHQTASKDQDQTHEAKNRKETIYVPIFHQPYCDTVDLPGQDVSVHKALLNK
jgi:hypothetical protein